MTDHANGRLDLRILGADPDAAREDEVMRGVLARTYVADRARADDIVRLERIRRHMLVAAAGLAAIAAGAALWAPRRVAADPVTEWAQAQHVPTNAELLTTFNGYRP